MRLLIALLIAGVLLFGCSGQASGSVNTPPPAGGSGKTIEIQMTAKQFEYSPSTITVKKGDRVKLLITSQDVTHGFSLPDFGVSATIEPGKTTTVEFTADKAGTFEFRCNVFCGTGHPNMKGTLVVTDSGGPSGPSG